MSEVQQMDMPNKAFSPNHSKVRVISNCFINLGKSEIVIVNDGENY